MMTKADAGEEMQTPAVEKVTLTRDPFDTLSADVSPEPRREKETPLPQLLGVLWDESNPFAILSHDGNRYTVRVGTVVAGATVISIEPQQVIVQREQMQYPLHLWTPRGIRFTAE